MLLLRYASFMTLPFLILATLGCATTYAHYATEDTPTPRPTPTPYPVIEPPTPEDVHFKGGLDYPERQAILAHTYKGHGKNRLT